MYPSISHCYLIGILLIPICSQAATESVPLYREIKDWVIACDNTRSCTAISAPEQGQGSGSTLLIQRDAGVEGKLTVRLNSGLKQADGQLRKDGHALTSPLVRSLQRNQNDDEELIFSARDSDAQNLLQELRNASTLSLGAKNRQKISLRGLSAAMLLIDSVQGRVGTRTALLRHGALPASAVPPAPPTPTLRPFPAPPPLSLEERQRLVEATMQLSRDSNATEEQANPAEGEAYALNASEALVLIRISCAAYNCEYAVFRTPRDNPSEARPLDVEILPLGHPIGFSGHVWFDQKTGVLNTYFKARGLADCGDSESWQFDGKHFQLQSYAYMGRCTGGRPDHWPIVWRSTESE